MHQRPSRPQAPPRAPSRDLPFFGVVEMPSERDDSGGRVNGEDVRLLQERVVDLSVDADVGVRSRHLQE